MIELRHLSYFIAVVEAKSYSLASERIYVAQSALSRQIIQLEKLVGCKLLERSSVKNAPVRPTPAGAELYKRGKKLLEEAAFVVKTAQKANMGIKGTLRIATNRLLPLAYIPLLIQEFRVKYPEVDIYIKELSPAEQYRALENDELDLGFGTMQPTPNYPNINAISIRKDPLAIIVHKEHPLAGRKTLSIKELIDEKFIFPSREQSPVYYDWLIKIAADAGFAPHIEKLAERVTSLFIYVSAGLGIGFHPVIQENVPAHLVRLIPINDIDATVEQVLTWKRKGDPLIDNFVQTALAFSGSSK